MCNSRITNPNNPHMYCTGGTECLNLTLHSHPVCAVSSTLPHKDKISWFVSSWDKEQIMACPSATCTIMWYARNAATPTCITSKPSPWNSTSLSVHRGILITTEVFRTCFFFLLRGERFPHQDHQGTRCTWASTNCWRRLARETLRKWNLQDTCQLDKMYVCVCIYLCINSSVLRETEIFMVQKFASVKKRCSRNMYKE